jgi:quercetin dioxygenase-like cupin family protein
MSSNTSRILHPGKPVALAELADYAQDAVVSKTLIKNDAGNLTLFAFDAGQGLSEHSAPFDAIVTVLEGLAEVSVEGEPRTVNAGETILLPANVPHAVHARDRFKMLLTMIRG